MEKADMAFWPRVDGSGEVDDMGIEQEQAKRRWGKEAKWQVWNIGTVAEGKAVGGVEEINVFKEYIARRSIKWGVCGVESLVADRVVVSFEGVGADAGADSTVVSYYFGGLRLILERHFWWWW